MTKSDRNITEEVGKKVDLLSRLVSDMKIESESTQHATSKMALAMSDLQSAAETGVRSMLSQKIFSRDLRESWQSNMSIVQYHPSPCSWFFDSASWTNWLQNRGILWVLGDCKSPACFDLV